MIVSWLIVAAASALLFLSVWIVIPGWSYWLLTLSVGATEYSPWLCVAGVIVCLLARGSSRLSHAAFVMAGGAALLASTPLARAPFALRRFDAEMSRAFGDGFLNRVPVSVIQGMRERPIVVADLFRGIAWGDASVVHGIVFARPDGQALTVTVYRPKAPGRFPGIVQIYGGAWQRGEPDDDPGFARYLAARGYFVFAIDYRHAPRWAWPAQMDDVRAAFDWIHAHAAEHSADPSRLAVMGRSAGAQLALESAYGPYGLPVRAVVSYYGPVDLAEGYRHPPQPDPLDVRAVDEAFLAGTPDSAPARYRDASPITYVTRRLPPTLLIHGSRDHIVEARFGRMLQERLLATGTPSALLEMPWAEHAFDAVPHGVSAQIALYYTERFLAGALAAP
jgi:acetyl esterase/lipase